MSILFTPIKIGDIELKNRIIMAPMTRCRAVGGKGIPNKLMVEYYEQRATAGLIISEGTSISPMGVGYPNVPGIWLKEQIEGWKKITEAVHNAGGKIFCQLWHVGRISDPHYLNGKKPIAPSAIPANGHINLLRPKRPYTTPHAIQLTEIPPIIEEFRQAAQNALEANFDGVELHGANGYLLDQFLQDISNTRDDIYGGSIENRARFMLEVVDAVSSVWGASRVGMHLAPRCDLLSMGDSNPLKTFTYVAKELGKRKIAFLCARARICDDKLHIFLKKAFGGIYIINQGLTKEVAETEIEKGHADAAAWGELFIANPDLPTRFEQEFELNTPDSKTYYTFEAEGYTDYPSIVW